MESKDRRTYNEKNNKRKENTWAPVLAKKQMMDVGDTKDVGATKSVGDARHVFANYIE